jgi:hypothetical protein
MQYRNDASLAVRLATKSPRPDIQRCPRQHGSFLILSRRPSSPHDRRQLHRYRAGQHHDQGPEGRSQHQCSDRTRPGARFKNPPEPNHTCEDENQPRQSNIPVHRCSLVANGRNDPAGETTT